MEARPDFLDGPGQEPSVPMVPEPVAKRDVLSPASFTRERRRPAAVVDGRAPMVTVGVPVYNGERFLPQALDSLLGQSFEDLEVLISDNVSTDRTAEICQDYATRDPRIRYVRRTEHIGAPGNWNFVARHARGRYLKWSSANDYCGENLVEKCVAVMEADPRVVLCQARTCLVDDETGKRTLYDGDISATQEHPSERLRVVSVGLALNNLQSGLIRLDALRKTRLDRPYQGGDRVLIAELALQGFIAVVPEVMFYRRIGRASVSALLSEENLRRFLDPSSECRPGWNTVRLFADYLATIARADVEWGEKLKSAIMIGRQAVWNRQSLWKEIMAGLRLLKR